jgi:large subunit ribosomal protein L21
MYAIINEGGGQRLVRKDEVLLIDLIDDGQAAVGKKITFSEVLAIGPGDGKTAAKVGTPLVSGAKVEVEVLEPLAKGDKIYIHKFRRRKGYRRKTGHRQQYTKVKVVSIHG